LSAAAHPELPMNTPKSPWRRLKAGLDRKDFGAPSYPIQNEIIRLKQEGFVFLLDIVERRDGNLRQIKNAAFLAFSMRGWDRERFFRAVLGLCTHEDFKLRSVALHLLLGALEMMRRNPGERILAYDEHAFDENIQETLALGVHEGPASRARKYLEG
jgi:hypothetical protein